jgi:stalled ribosome rescue protein Dom34
MKAKRKVGIWLDHATARVIEYNTQEIKAITIKSDLLGLDNQDSSQHSESLLHHKENKKLKAFYKAIIAIVENYDEILLFGPTTAKTELLNLIREEHKYEHLKIENKSAQKMTPPDEHTFVVNHFKTVLNYESPFTK